MDDELVAKVARALATELMRQDYMVDPAPPPESWNYTWPYIDQGEVEFLPLARAALAVFMAEYPENGRKVKDD